MAAARTGAAPAPSSVPSPRRHPLARLVANMLESALLIVVVLATAAFAADTGHALANPPRTVTPADAARILAQPSTGIHRARTLAAFARDFRHADVQVSCVSTRARWLELASSHVLGFVRFDQPLHVYLGPTACQVAREAFSDPGIVSRERAVGLQVLVHELIHTTGLTSEGQTGALSFQLYRSTLVRYLGYDREQATEMDADAWSYHLGRSAAYQLPGPRTYAPWPAA